MSDLNKPKKQLNPYIQFTGIGFQMGVTFYLAAYFGKKLDAKYQLPKPYFTIGFILLGLIISIYNLVNQLKHLNKK